MARLLFTQGFADELVKLAAIPPPPPAPPVQPAAYRNPGGSMPTITPLKGFGKSEYPAPAVRPPAAGPNMSQPSAATASPAPASAPPSPAMSMPSRAPVMTPASTASPSAPAPVGLPKSPFQSAFQVSPYAQAVGLARPYLGPMKPPIKEGVGPKMMRPDKPIARDPVTLAKGIPDAAIAASKAGTGSYMGNLVQRVRENPGAAIPMAGGTLAGAAGDTLGDVAYKATPNVVRSLWGGGSEESLPKPDKDTQKLIDIRHMKERKGQRAFVKANPGAMPPPLSQFTPKATKHHPGRAVGAKHTGSGMLDRPIPDSE